ncbi:MAG: protein kinase [Vicinamibacterales bacterium]
MPHRAGLVGQTLLQYRILEPLGHGGMGEVYLAEDMRLGRRTALKFLTGSAVSDPEARARLAREARAAAVLRSPHVAVTYDLIEQDDALFIAMEYVEGELLSTRIARGPLAVGDALDIAMQVADALDEAHGHGIIHRDIKSANLMLTPRQLVKVLDFGLAKFAAGADHLHTMAGSATMAGSVIGTVHYMAPEQLLGSAVDHRVDLFALGVVLYEMLAARLPFPGTTLPEIVDRVLNHEPEAIARYNYAVPADVEATLRKSLEKNPAFRYQSARELYVDLANARRRLTGDGSSRASMTWRGPIDFTDPAAGLPVAPPPAPARSGPRSLAVLSFANITGDPADDWIGQGVAESLTADLSHVAGLTVMPREQIFDQLRTFSSVGHALDERQAIDLGRRLGAWWVLTGGYQHLGPRVRFTANVIEVQTGSLATTVKLDGTVEALFDLQDALVQQVARGLDPGIDSGVIEAAAAVSIEPASLEAYEAFSRGMLNLRLAGRESFERAIALFEHAIALAPDYPDAIAGLGAAYQLKATFMALPDLNRKAIELLKRAVALNPSLVDARIRLGMGLLAEGTTAEAIALLEAVVAEQPGNAQARQTLGRAYWVSEGRVDEAIRELEQAVRLNAESGYAYLQLAFLDAMSGRLDEAERAARAAIVLQEQAMSGTQGVLVVGAHSRLGYVHYLRGWHDEAIAEYRREMDFLSASDHVLRERTLIELNAKMGAAYLAKGDGAMADEHFARALSSFNARLAAGADDGATRYYVASIFALRGDAAHARTHLQRPLAEQPRMTRWRVARDHDFDAVRDALSLADA